ncbi:glycosyltransferase [Flavivirga aquimarina]|uniref:Glycosyltransferase n=1 Tax=Flavivirga aquimarina TaxID=2027862 RepID=A0ABT8WDJ3_9FLAO|nr:glycosyltransferase [Flavivirga aquimarina]MDO5971190.1 glycosyltransferase [Flavivirga aquimarina]
MKLSILIPMYNANKYIGNCLDSLLNQDISKDEYEIIVMDDGSTDNSVELVKKYQLKSSNIILHEEENVGTYSTRNKLFKLAKGKYIYNIDADDYIVHNSLGALLKIAFQNDVDVLGFGTLETIELDLLGFDNKLTVSDTMSGMKFLKDYRYLRHEIWWYFVKTTFIKSNGLWFDANEYFGDTTFTLKLLSLTKKMIYVQESIHRYVQTTDSIMRNKDLSKRKKQIENMFISIYDYSKFINNIQFKNGSQKKAIMDNLMFRRDALTFFTLLKMIRLNLNTKKIKEQIKALKAVQAYPITNFLGKEHNSLHYKILTKILNNEFILYKLATLFNVLKIKLYR